MEGDSTPTPLVERLGAIADPRIEKKNDHALIDILVIAVCAVICGAEHWTEIEDFGKCKETWFRSFLKLKNGIPSHDTIGRVFALIDPEEFRPCYADWIQDFMKGVDVHHICSKRLTAAEFAKVARNHWGIENSLHGVLDVAFSEDACRVHSGHAAENFTMLRHMALGMLKQGTRVKRGIKTRRKVAGWDENYLLELLKGELHA